MIGAPGSGKTTWLAKNHPTATVCSADHYRTTPEGVYRFVAADTGDCHSACLRKFIRSCEYDLPQDLACDNTNATLEDIAPYIAVAQAYGLQVEVVLCECLAAYERQTHGVPREAWNRIFRNISQMIYNWPMRWPQLRTVFT